MTSVLSNLGLVETKRMVIRGRESSDLDHSKFAYEFTASLAVVNRSSFINTNNPALES